ncbi:hypothetical protein [Microvirga puerhi]|uniref:Chromosome partition protein Smc n=1 Tax=Microvirga puerhi TaxID=2876078 RepID=A0ABS7VR26_9HYPH|nr:hypothetical protein [Microvirga puerhi]MBZ6078006.1 hypothetical protein [Microvirga puerhi]
MTNESIWQCLTNRYRHVLMHPEARRTRSGLVLTVAAAGIVIGPWSSIAEGSDAGEGLPPAEYDSAVAPVTSHSSATLSAERVVGGPQAGDLQPYWVAALRMPITSDGRGALVARLGTLIREGNPTRAKEVLSSTIEMGTLAFMILLHFDDPALHARLQEMAANGQNMSVDSADGALKARSTGADVMLPGREENSPQLTAADEHSTAPETSRARAAELEAALEQEKSRTASAMHDLEMVKKQLADMTESLTDVAALKDEAAREKSRAEAALVELLDARQQLSALKRSALELETVLALEKERYDFVTQERKALEQKLTAMQTDRVKTVEIENALVQEKQRADAALQQLNSLQDKLSGLSEAVAKKQEEIEREKERSALGAQQLESARGEIANLGTHLNELGEVNVTLRQEKEDATATLRELQMVNGQLAALVHMAKPKPLQKGLRPRQLTASPVRGKAMSRSQYARIYGRVRQGGSWTGLMGGYGNAKGSRTNNGPGVW